VEEKWVLPVSYFSAETPNILEELNFIPSFGLYFSVIFTILLDSELLDR